MPYFLSVLFYNVREWVLIILALVALRSIWSTAYKTAWERRLRIGLETYSSLFPFPPFDFVTPESFLLDFLCPIVPGTSRLAGQARLFPRGWPTSSEVRYSTRAMTIFLSVIEFTTREMKGVGTYICPYTS